MDGTEQVAYRFCPSCGVEAPAINSFCGSCGRSLSAEKSSAEKPTTVQSEQTILEPQSLNAPIRQHGLSRTIQQTVPVGKKLVVIYRVLIAWCILEIIAVLASVHKWHYNSDQTTIISVLIWTLLISGLYAIRPHRVAKR
jgi:uncharacterized membrane protein YvbJ